MKTAADREGWADLLAVPLAGERVALEPLCQTHAEELWEAAPDPRIWQWLAHVGSSRGYFDRWMETSLAAAAAGEEGVFATATCATAL